MQAAISRDSHCFVVDGTSALKTEAQPRLYVVDGERASMSEQKARSNAGASAFPFFATVVFAAVSLLIAAIFISEDATRTASAADALRSTGIAYVVVVPGDTIWDLAESHKPSGTQTSDVVDWIRRENNLITSNLRIGQSLMVPNYSSL